MDLTAVRAGAYLHHIHLSSPDPERLAAFYARAMDMEPAGTASGAFLLAGPGRRLLLSEGQPKRLVHGAFAVRDRASLAELRARAEAERLDPEEAGADLLEDAFAVLDPDGNRILFGLARPDEERHGIRGPIQHLTLATRDVGAIEQFYAGLLGFAVSDRVVNDAGAVMTCFMRSNHEHHTLACFHQDRQGIDHHSYEAGEWTTIRDWCDHLAAQDIQLMWGPGRHGPGNNLFVFIKDPDENWIEISAELEVVHDRPVKEWPHAERTLNRWGRAIMRA
jgi:catechol 2,3-dioxygenase